MVIQIDGKIVPDGEGKMEYPDDAKTEVRTFKGVWGREGPEGKGTMYFKDGRKYEGYFFRGKFHGKGVLSLDGEVIFDGEFDQGQKHGDGMFVYYAHCVIWDAEDDSLFQGITEQYSHMKKLFQPADPTIEGQIRAELGPLRTKEFHSYRKLQKRQEEFDKQILLNYANSDSDPSLIKHTYTGKFKNGKKQGSGTL